MTRKAANGPIRNKERTKSKILDSLGEIIAKEGFSKLTVMKIARKAGIDKKLIYMYWGGFDGIVKAYLDSRPFLDFNPLEDESNGSYGQKDILNQFLEKYFDSLLENAEMSGIMAWKLNERITPLQELDQKHEQWREEMFNKMNEERFKDRDINCKAVGAILMGGLYYLALNRHSDNDSFCGIDMKDQNGKQEIKKAVQQILGWACGH
jgi:AcrR family transcriptional regulator